MGDSSLINLGELSKPATVLIEKISDAVGVLYEPTRIRRKAKAKSDVALIEANTALKIGDLERRALERFVKEQAREQENIESITAKALPHLSANSDSSKIDDDWLAEFFAYSRRVSNEEMQEIWSRILSGEANNPGSISHRTLDFVRLMDRSDAELFSKLCNLSAWSYNNPLVFDLKDEILKTAGLVYSDLAHLESVGLIQLADEMGSYVRKGMPQTFNLNVAGYLLTVSIENKGNESECVFEAGKVLLTRTGEELRRFVVIEPVDGFYEYCVKSWYSKKYILSSPLLQ